VRCSAWSSPKACSSAVLRVCSALCLALACLQSIAAAAEDKVLNLYNWADYIGENTIADFEREYGIEVNYDTYDASSTVDAKLLAGRSGYDIVIHSTTYAPRLQDAGVFAVLDRSRLDNWNNLDPVLLDRFEFYDPGLRYGVPYMWGTTGFTYNEKLILARMPDAPVNSAAMLFDPQVIQHFADCGVSLLEAPTDTIPMALAYLGLDPNSYDLADLKAAENLLKGVRPYLKTISSTKFMLDMPSEELCLAGTWSGDAARMRQTALEAGLDMTLRYTIPVEGSTIWFDAAYIPLDAPHPDNAHLFLNYLLRPEVIAEISNLTGYSNPNIAARPLLSPEYANDKGMYPDPETIARLSYGKLPGPKMARRLSRTWTRAKSGL